MDATASRPPDLRYSKLHFILKFAFNFKPSALALSVVLTIPAIAQADSYSYSIFNVTGNSATFAYGINNQNQIVGEVIGSDGFLLSNGNYTILDAPWSNRTLATGINDKGQIVGSTGSFFPDVHGFLYSNGGYTQIDVPGATSTQTSGINNSGEIVGTYFGATGVNGYIYQSGIFTTINDPNSVGGTFVHAINNKGQIVGESGSDGFLYSAGKYTQLDVPGATDTRAYGINDNGQIVGAYLDGSGATLGFLYSGGEYETIKYPGGFTTFAAGINDSGQIVGFTFGASTGDAGFIATPVPEPSTYALMLAGLGLISFISYRRKNDSSDMPMAAKTVSDMKPQRG